MEMVDAAPRAGPGAHNTGYLGVMGSFVGGKSGRDSNAITSRALPYYPSSISAPRLTNLTLPTG